MITKFYIDKAKYRAEDNRGKVIWVEINYWQNTFKISHGDKELERIAKNLLRRKHKVNFVYKLLK